MNKRQRKKLAKKAYDDWSQVERIDVVTMRCIHEMMKPTEPLRIDIYKNGEWTRVK